MGERDRTGLTRVMAKVGRSARVRPHGFLFLCFFVVVFFNLFFNLFFLLVTNVLHTLTYITYKIAYSTHIAKVTYNM